MTRSRLMTTTTLPPDNRPTVTRTPANVASDATRGSRRRIGVTTAVVLVAAAACGTAYLAVGSDQPTPGTSAATHAAAEPVAGARGIGADTGALVGHGTTTVLSPTAVAAGSSVAGGDTGALVGHGTTTVTGSTGVAGTNFGSEGGSATGALVGHGTTTTG
jgi:hypothetical protein